MTREMIIIDRSDDQRINQFRLRERELRPRSIPARILKGLTPETIPVGMFLAEGDLVVQRAMEAGCTMISALTDAASPAPLIADIPASIPVYAATEEARKILTGLGVALDIIALFQRPPEKNLQTVITTSRHLLMVEEVDNPTNVGAIVRSAVAFGVQGLILDRTSADPLARRALRVSMGTALALQHCRIQEIAQTIHALQEAGFLVCGLTPHHQARDIHSLGNELSSTSQVAIVLGSERTGLTAQSLAMVNFAVRIPMSNGIDSLNVAAAAAVACYALIPQANPGQDEKSQTSLRDGKLSQ